MVVSVQYVLCLGLAPLCWRRVGGSGDFLLNLCFVILMFLPHALELLQGSFAFSTDSRVTDSLIAKDFILQHNWLILYLRGAARAEKERDCICNAHGRTNYMFTSRI